MQARIPNYVARNLDGFDAQALPAALARSMDDIPPSHAVDLGTIRRTGLPIHGSAEGGYNSSCRFRDLSAVAPLLSGSFIHDSTTPSIVETPQEWRSVGNEVRHHA
jgi:hypothetical protein